MGLLLDAVLQKKQGNLTEVVAGSDVETAIQAWDEGRKEILRLNGVLEVYVTQIKQLKESIDATELPRLGNELKTLQAAKKRHEPDTITVIQKLDEHNTIKEDLAKEKATVKKELNAYVQSRKRWEKRLMLIWGG